ncbi:MAG: hypothetical protein KF788_15620 [Piscinibacter sp.]|nr:hypothetical protein [Piscinibacter sp.]
MNRRRAALVLLAAGLAAACASGPPTVSLPLQQGWFDGEVVFYVTTDVSDAAVARDKQANHAPRLAGAAHAAGPAAPLDTVYAVTNFAQGGVFASAPDPIGPLSRDASYSPLWRMVAVTWVDPARARVLKSEEEVLAAQEAGHVRLVRTDIVLNCPIVHRGPRGGLPGVQLRTAP